MKHIFERMAQDDAKREFSDLEADTLKRMSPKELASWQHSQPDNSPQQIFANREWERRNIKQQVKAGYTCAIIGVLGTLAGVLIGANLSSLNDSSEAQNQAEEYITAIPSVSDVTPNESPKQQAKNTDP